MAVNVYAFPPVGLVGHSWTEDAPVAVSRSLLSGKRYVSAAQRKRRLAHLVVPALSRSGDNAGAGYMEMLKKFLSGGENLVRLHSPAINWNVSAAVLHGSRQSRHLDWTAGGVDLDWTAGGVDLLWYTGTLLTCTVTTDGGWPALAVSGLPANAVIARPGEFLTVFEDEADTTGETVQAITVARSDGNGDATVRVMTAPSHGGRVNIGTSETAVFEATDMPTPDQPLRGNWTYAWSFREVFADEVAGGFTEVNPWT